MEQYVSPKVFVAKSKSADGKGVFAKEKIRKGEKLVQITGSIFAKQRNKNFMQIGEGKYIGGPIGTIDDFINHSCNPNCKMKFVHGKIFLTSIRGISRGEELTFHYCSTDNDLGEFSFECSCGSKNCLKKIRGFKYLKLKEKNALKKLFSPFILKKFKEELKTISHA